MGCIYVLQDRKEMKVDTKSTFASNKKIVAFCTLVMSSILQSLQTKRKPRTRKF